MQLSLSLRRSETGLWIWGENNPSHLPQNQQFVLTIICFSIFYSQIQEKYKPINLISCEIGLV